jgi:hypothetical protein
MLVAFGIFCLLVPLLTLWEYRDWKTAPGVVRVYPEVAYGRTNRRTEVAYTRDDGTRTVVTSSLVPAGARSGDQFTVLYSPHQVKASVVYTFDTFWSFPIYATVVGVVLTSLGVFARARRRIVFTESHANA